MTADELLNLKRPDLDEEQVIQVCEYILIMSDDDLMMDEAEILSYAHYLFPVPTFHGPHGCLDLSCFFFLSACKSPG